MIVFDLQCANGHVFEGWFQDNSTYEDQVERALIECPVCNDRHVEKILTPFAIKTAPSESRPMGPVGDESLALEQLGKKIVEYVDKNFDNVGVNFAKEALKIHYGASEPRNIRGVSTTEEEKMLKDEGIGFFKVPVPAPADSEE